MWRLMTALLAYIPWTRHFLNWLWLHFTHIHLNFFHPVFIRWIPPTWLSGCQIRGLLCWYCIADNTSRTIRSTIFTWQSCRFTNFGTLPSTPIHNLSNRKSFFSLLFFSGFSSAQHYVPLDTHNSGVSSRIGFLHIERNLVLGFIPHVLKPKHRIQSQPSRHSRTYR